MRDESEPLRSVEDAIEAAACISLARWLVEQRRDVAAVELDGAGRELWSVNAMTIGDDGVTLRPVSGREDPELWAQAVASWELLHSVSRAIRRVISADEAQQWNRGWP